MTIIVTRAGKGSPLTNAEMDANLNNLNTQGGTITTVASATTPDIFAVSVGRVIDYTGTATATGFVAAPQAGLEKELLCADAAVFTAGANFIIAGTASASNYTAVAGDRLLIVAETTSKFRMYALRASGAPNFAAGTVAAPAIYLSTDTGTGLYRIGANNDGFAISGAKVLDIASTGLAVTGTLSSSAASSAYTGLQVGTGGGANTGLIIGNYSSGVGGIWCTAVTPSSVNYALAATTTVVSVNAPSGGTVNLNTNNVTTMSINSTGHTVGGASSPVSGVYGTNSFKTSTVSQTVLNLTQDATSSPFGMFLAYGAIDPNNTSSEFLYFTGGGTLRFSVRSNGGIVNFQANDSNLSDIRTKKNIELAGNYLDKICAIPVKTFLYKDQTDEFLNLGVIAQDVEAVAPELIDSGGFGETPEDGVPLKSIYQTDLQFALMKAIQELAAKVAKLEAA